MSYVCLYNNKYDSEEYEKMCEHCRVMLSKSYRSYVKNNPFIHLTLKSFATSYCRDKWYHCKSEGLEKDVWKKLFNLYQDFEEGEDMPKGSIYEWIVANDMIERDTSRLTKEEWIEIRNSGDPDAISEAVERMEAQGGYDNLD